MGEQVAMTWDGEQVAMTWNGETGGYDMGWGNRWL